MHFERILVLGPHTDDAELGCGGTISRLLEEGVQIHVAAFSTAEESRPPGAPVTQLRDEFLEAMRCLGVPDQQILVYNYPVRRLSDHRQAVLEELVRLKRELQPQLVLLPSGSDVHQDHQVLHLEGVRAFKDLGIWGYELPWNHVAFSAQAFVTLEKRHVDAKWRALRAYRSQFEMARPYFTWEFVEGLARVRGVQVRVPYAEAFDVMRIRW